MTRRHYTLAAQAAVVVGAFLPWISFLGVTALGVEGDGVLTLCLGLLGAFLALLGRPRRRGARVATQAVLASLVAVVALVHLDALAAAGVYVTLVAALVWLALAVVPERRTA